MSLIFNILSRLIIAFLPRSKHLLISWLQPPSAVILEPKKIKSNNTALNLEHMILLISVLVGYLLPDIKKLIEDSWMGGLAS